MIVNKRALSASAAETIVLGSTEKLNAVSPYFIAPISEVTGINVAAETKSKTPRILLPHGYHGNESLCLSILCARVTSIYKYDLSYLSFDPVM